MVIKVVSLNIWMGNLLDPALEFLRQTDADVVLLQEVLDGRGEQFKPAQKTRQTLRQLGYEYERFDEMFKLKLTEGSLSLGNAVLSKYPIETGSVRYFFESSLPEYLDIPEHWPLEPRFLQHAQLKASAGPLNVFNVHGIWDLNGDDFSPARQNMLRIILEEIDGQPNVILAGDTNASMGNPLWRELEKHLKNVFGLGLQSTFNMRRKTNPGYATAAVDLMFVSPNFKVLSKACPDVDISDHRPIVVELEI